MGPYTGNIFQNNTDPYAIASFPIGAPLVAGRSYAIIVENTADDCINNWRSVDGLAVAQVDPLLDAPNLALLNGQPHPTNVPMWEVLYASTVDIAKSPSAQGIGYVDVANGASVALPNARQAITPSKTIVVTSGALSLRGFAGPGTISIAGTTAVLYPPAVPNGWSPFYFANPLTLNAGSSYYLQPMGAGSAVPLQKGWSRASDGVTQLFTFGPQTFFNEGHAEQLVNGTWGFWVSEQGAPDPRMDLMFYLDVQN